MATMALTGMTPNFQTFHVLIFGAGMTEYHLHRLLKFYTLNKTLRTEKFRWMAENQVLTWILFLFPLAIVFVSLFYVNDKVKQLFLLSGIITLLYSVPLKGWLGYLSLRKVPLLKTLLVALVWSMVTVLIPAAGSSAEMPVGHISWIFTERFLLIFSLALLFDDRDSESDREKGVQTIPNIYGHKLTMRLVVFLLVLFVIGSFTEAGFYSYAYPFVSALLIAAMLTFLMFCRKCQTNPYFYNVFLDGSLIIYSLMVIGGWFLFSGS